MLSLFDLPALESVSDLFSPDEVQPAIRSPIEGKPEKGWLNVEELASGGMESELAISIGSIPPTVEATSEGADAVVGAPNVAEARRALVAWIEELAGSEQDGAVSVEVVVDQT